MAGAIFDRALEAVAELFALRGGAQADGIANVNIRSASIRA